jgi:hypothetical protein
MVSAVCQSSVRSARRDPQKLQVDKRVQGSLAECRVRAVESLRLGERQPQTWHFQILGANAVHQSLMRHGHLLAVRCRLMS